MKDNTQSNTIKQLINLFAKFPTVGPRTASRFVFYLLSLSKEELKELTTSINKLKDNVKLCTLCFKSFEPKDNKKDNLCEICKDNTREKGLLCVIEKEMDLIPIEKTKKYRGLYFILGGTIPTLKKEDVKKIKVKELLERVKDSDIEEVILALNPTTEGEATTLYLERKLKPLDKKISRLARGLPLGAELEYADEETISSALEGRK